MKPILLTPDQGAIFADAQSDIQGGQIIVKQAIREATTIVGDAHGRLSDLWTQLAKEHDLDIKNEKFYIDKDNGLFFIGQHPEEEQQEPEEKIQA